VIWRLPVGAGRLVVSGALDAWRFRDAATSAFDAFWRGLIAESASASSPPIRIDIDRPVLQPGETTEVVVTLREPALADLPGALPVRASVSAALEGEGDRTSIRLWPDGPVGRFSGSIRSPASPGTFRVMVESGDAFADSPLIVTDEVARPARVEPDLVSAWARAHGGVVFAESARGQLRESLTRTLQMGRRPEMWHPMRSAWWIVPFALALGFEWWWRRRRGLA
jgi:hypothetical protein